MAVVSCALLAACGGGGDDNSSASGPAMVDPYLGAWSYPCEVVSTVPGSEQSSRFRMTVTKASPVSMNMTPVELAFSSVDCSGGSTATLYGTALLTYTGIRMVGGERCRHSRPPGRGDRSRCSQCSRTASSTVRTRLLRWRGMGTTQRSTSQFGPLGMIDPCRMEPYFEGFRFSSGAWVGGASYHVDMPQAPFASISGR